MTDISLTLDMLRQMQSRMDVILGIRPIPRQPVYNTSAAEVQIRVADTERRLAAIPKIISSPLALRPSNERLFPASKNRSKRIHKKLVKRFGGEFRMIPAMWHMGDMIVAHPALYEQLRREMNQPF